MMNRLTQATYNLHDCVDLSFLQGQMVHPTNHHDPLLHDPTLYHSGFAEDFSDYFPDPLMINYGIGGNDEGLLVTTAGSSEPNPCLRTMVPCSALDCCGSWSGTGTGSGLMMGAGSGHRASQEKMNGLESFTKRKFDNVTESKGVGKKEAAPKDKKKKVRVSKEEDCKKKSKITEQNNLSFYTDTKSMMKNSKPKKGSSSNEPLKDDWKDFIRGEGRQGQATNSQNLAERVRIEKMNERMKYFQELVHGCFEIKRNAGMLEENINYVQSLQRENELLLMKLAAVGPNPDFNVNGVFDIEGFSDPRQGNPCMMIPTPGILHSGYEQKNPMQQLVSYPGTETVITSSSDVVQTTDYPLCLDDSYIDPTPFYNGEVPSMSEFNQPYLDNSLGMNCDPTTLAPQPSTGFTSISEMNKDGI